MLKKQGFTLTEEGWTLRLPEKLLFGFDQSDIQASQKPALEALSKQLQQYNLNKIKVVGHTDNIGDPSYNQTLSEKRASTVSQIFIETGFKTQNIQSMGRGASQPLVENSSAESSCEYYYYSINISVLCFILSLRHEGFFIYCTKLQA